MRAGGRSKKIRVLACRFAAIMEKNIGLKNKSVAISSKDAARTFSLPLSQLSIARRPSNFTFRLPRPYSALFL